MGPDVHRQRLHPVREGGEVLERIELDRNPFGCMLGGPDGRTLFILAAKWRGIEEVDKALAAGPAACWRTQRPRRERGGHNRDASALETPQGIGSPGTF